MSWKSLPPSTPAALLRHPILLTEWLRLTNRLRRRADSSVLIDGRIAHQWSAAEITELRQRDSNAMEAALASAASKEARQ